MIETSYPFDISVSQDTVRLSYRLSSSTERYMARGNLKFTEELCNKALILHHTLRLQFRSSDTSAQIVKEQGSVLGDILFDESLRRTFLFAIDQIRKEDPHGIVRIRMSFEDTAPPQLASLPWELCQVLRPLDIVGDTIGFSSASNIIFSRGEAHPNIAPLSFRNNEKLRILLVIAQPDYDAYKNEDMPSVYYEKTMALLQQHAQNHQNLVDLQIIEDGKSQNTTLPFVKTTISNFRPHVVHFIGHGRLEATQSIVAFSDDVSSEFRNAVWHSHDNFATLFEDFKPFLVLLQSCETAAVAEVYDHNSIAGYLVKYGIPLVVAMQYEIKKATAARFAQNFYTAIFDKSRSVEWAVQFARLKLLEFILTKQGIDSNDSGAYATPVLFAIVSDTSILPPSYIVNNPTQSQSTTEITVPLSVKENYFNKEYDIVITKLTEVIPILLDRDKINALYYRALSYLQRQSYDQALADIAHILQIEPNHVQAKKLRDKAFKFLGD